MLIGIEMRSYGMKTVLGVPQLQLCHSVVPITIIQVHELNIYLPHAQSLLLHMCTNADMIWTAGFQ